MPTNTFFNLPIDKQNKIIEAAIEEFSERSIDESKIALIMKRANISRASFYNYFDSIEDLYLYTIILLRNQRLEYLKKDTYNDNDLTFFEYFKDFYLRAVKYLLDNPHYIKITKHLYASYNKICVGLMDSLQQRYYDIYSEKINLDKEKGIIRKDVDTDMLSNICVHYSTIIFVYETQHDKELTIEYFSEYIDRLINILSKGVINDVNN